MTTAFKELCAVAKTKPKAGEDFVEFAKRLTDKINNVTDPEWQSLGDGSAAQTWHNDTMTAFTARKNAKAEAKKNDDDEDAAVDAITIPELEGYEAVPGDDTEDEPKDAAEKVEEEQVDPDTGEVTEVAEKKAKSVKKDKKEKPEKKAKPEKKEKVVKAEKPAKAPKPAKVVKEKKAKPAKSAEARGRRSLFEDTDKVKVLAKPNPHREGSTRFKEYEKLKDGRNFYNSFTYQIIFISNY